MTLGKGRGSAPLHPEARQGASPKKLTRGEERGTMTAPSVPLKRRAPWRGRPRVEEPKAHPFSVRLTRQQRDELDAMADRVGLSRGAFARAVLLGIPEPRGRRRPPVDVKEIARLYGELGRVGSNINQLSHHAHLTQALPTLDELRSINVCLTQMHDELRRALGRET